MSYTYLQEQEGEYLEVNCLDIPQSVLSKLKNTQDKYYCSDNETESCQSFQSGTTSALSMENPGEDQLTFFAEDSHAKTSVQQVKEQELPDHVRDFGKSMRESLAKYGLALSLPKTHHCFALGDLPLSSKIWPRWGMMLDGACWELGTSVRHIKETECGSWLTPTTMDKLPPKSAEALHKEATQARPGRSRPANLRDCVHPEQMKAWPTPTAHNAKEQDSPSEATRNTPSLCHQARGGDKTQPRHLNPSWVEWLMGWPIGYTDLKPLETDKYHNVQQWHSEFYQKD